MNEPHAFADLRDLIRREMGRVDSELADGGKALLACLENLEAAPEEFEEVVDLFSESRAMKERMESEESLRESQRASGQVYCYRNVLNLLDVICAGLVKVHPDSAIVLGPEFVAFVVALLIPWRKELR